MSRSHPYLVLVAVCALGAPATAPASDDAERLEGAWKLVRQERLDPGGWVDADRGPSLFIFANGYYSTMYVPGVNGRSEPRKPFPDPTDVTDAQKAEAWNSIVADSGTYEVSGSEITYHAIVAKSPNAMGEQASYKQTFSFEGDSLKIRWSFSESGPHYVRTLERLD